MIRTVQEFLDFVENDSALTNIKDVELVDKGDVVVVKKLPVAFDNYEHNEKEEKKNNFKRFLHQSLGKEIVFEDEKQFNTNDFPVSEIDVSFEESLDDFESDETPSFGVSKPNEKDEVDPLTIITFNPADTETKKRITPFKIILKVDEVLFNALYRSGIISNTDLVRVRDMLKPVYDKRLVLSHSKRDGLIDTVHLTFKNTLVETDTVEIEEEALLFIILFINKLYGKAYRSSYMPVFEHFNEFLANGLTLSSGSRIEPLSNEFALQKFISNRIREKIQNKDAFTFINQCIVDHLKPLQSVLFNHEDELMQKADQNKKLVLTAIDHGFLDYNDDIKFYLNVVDVNKLAVLYSAFITKFYVQAIYYGIDEHFKLNKAK
ncbi:hypothetical protein PVK64_14850 [Aliivibrio sp. S4TY2]|uniref:Uncharacterized protein n=1 Tax=Aliivibrio finisterrensis TaxID=511998 RepID=A0A4V1Z8S3_9GAMM|nr:MULTISPECIES: hypothetical protein [Aliivibrio]MDD9157450.1 hypothetical protein [Aliivibrio sp. S4TY2]MDD9161356.1 hypothetical protein [Aliivibrio sp. S4TY1]MDD9165386.1 hypothetical protein [Aliivibrio sp. S4MY2]MDD9169359.1 hypothetical protein [Aliivibrio sp. S4MY4]MDD9179239.1 hypothetical protein [Aliivibrio sp. A6]